MRPAGSCSVRPVSYLQIHTYLFVRFPDCAHQSRHNLPLEPRPLAGCRSADGPGSRRDSPVHGRGGRVRQRRLITNNSSLPAIFHMAGPKHRPEGLSGEMSCLVGRPARICADLREDAIHLRVRVAKWRHHAALSMPAPRHRTACRARMKQTKA